MSKAYQLRRIVEVKTLPARHGKGEYPRDILECGHILTHREPKSTAEAVRFAWSGSNRRRRCYKCCSSSN